MGKAAAILGVGAGGSAVVVGGNYALGNPIGSALYPKGEKIGDISNDKDSKAEEISEDVDHQRCLETYFPGFDLEHERENEAEWRKKLLNYANKKIEQSFFTFSSEQTPKSCLSINWVKEKENNKWEGDFSWLGTFSQGNRGIIWNISANTTDKASVPLELSGGIYFLKREKEEWHVYRHKEVKTTTTITEKIDQSNFKDRFPSVGDGIVEKNELGTDKDYWGFISGDSDLANVRTSSDSDSNSLTKTWFSGLWEGRASDEKESKKLFDWSGNAHTGINELYRDQSTKGKIKDIFEKKKGNWVKQSLVGSSIKTS